MTQRSINLFLKRLKELRKEAGFTQQDVADKLKLNQATYSAMERGSQSILLDYLFQIADLLKIPVWQLFAEPETVGTFDEKDRDFFEMWKHFDITERGLLKEIAKQIMLKKNLELQLSSFLPEKISQVS